MTAQIHDRVRWRRAEYLLVGVDGDVLFDPRDHGLDPAPTTTANWRGWVAEYEVRNDGLLLVGLSDVGFPRGPEASLPALWGTKPVREQERGPYRYEGLDRPLAFTGRVIVARGFIQSLYRHMGFHPAWKFEESWELAFESGRLTSSQELSDEMRKTRADIGSGSARDPDDVSRPGWIERTFRLSFRRSKIEER